MPGQYLLIRFFEEIGIGDAPLVGGKNASLGEMVRELTPKWLLVQNGFAITAEAYQYALSRTHAWNDPHSALDGLNPAAISDLAPFAPPGRATSSMARRFRRSLRASSDLGGLCPRSRRWRRLAQVRSGCGAIKVVAQK